MNIVVTKRMIFAGALMLCGAAAQAGSVSVYVGYVDNLRPSGFFPSVWLGNSNVVSQTPTGQSLDAGAIRIDNNSGASITVSNFSVLFPAQSNTFSIWSPLTIANGQIGIFTQTGSYNFDTSDFGIFGGSPPTSLAPNNYLGNGNSSLIGGCSSSATLIAAAMETTNCANSNPIISYSLNGGTTMQSFTDTGQILNTGGWDFVNNSYAGEDGNESINWNLVGSAAVRGGNGGNVPEPGTLGLLAAALGAMAFVRRKRTS